MSIRITAPLELDAYSADELRAMVLAVEEGDVIVDFSECEFIDSTGISALMEAHERAVEDGRSFALSGVEGQVARVLAMAGLDDEFDIVE